MKINTKSVRILWSSLAVLGLMLFPALGGFDSAQAKHEGRHDNGRHLGWSKNSRTWHQDDARFNRARANYRNRIRDWRSAYYRQRALNRARAISQRNWRNNQIRSNRWRTGYYWRPTRPRYYRWRNPYTPVVPHGYRLVDSDYLTSQSRANTDAAIARSHGYYTTVNWDPNVGRYIVRKYLWR